MSMNLIRRFLIRMFMYLLISSLRRTAAQYTRSTDDITCVLLAAAVWLRQALQWDSDKGLSCLVLQFYIALNYRIIIAL